MKYKTPLGALIYKYRSENHISQNEFADMAQISRGYLSELEVAAKNGKDYGQKQYRGYVIHGCAQAMGISPEELEDRLDGSPYTDERDRERERDREHEHEREHDDKPSSSSTALPYPNNLSSEDLKEISENVLDKLSQYTLIMSYFASKLSPIDNNDVDDENIHTIENLLLLNPSVKAIPILGSVAAGVPLLAQEEVIGQECINYKDSQSANYFGLKIKGKSMSPTIPDGSIVIVRQQDYAENGDIVIALVGDEEATCKKYVVNDHNIILVPLNFDFEPMYFTPEEVESKPVKILGKVVEARIRY